MSAWLSAGIYNLPFQYAALFTGDGFFYAEVKSFVKERATRRGIHHTNAPFCLIFSCCWCHNIFQCFGVSVVSDVNGKQMYYDRGSTFDCCADSRGSRKKLLLIDILPLVSRAISTWADGQDWKFPLQRYCVLLHCYVNNLCVLHFNEV